MKTLLAVMLLAASTQAGQVCSTQTFPTTSTNWSQTITLPKHAPSLGTLQSVTVTLRCGLSGAVRVENPAPGPAVYSTRLAFQGSVRRPDGSVLHALEPSIESQIPLGAFDGQIDFNGSSGRTLANMSTPQRETHVVLTNAIDIALFTAASIGELITLDVDAVGTSTATGPGALITAFDTNAAITLTVCYGYREACQSVAIDSQQTNYQTMRSFAKHDPSIGPLRAVRVRVNATVTGSARLESIETFSMLVRTSFAAITTVARPDNSSMLAVNSFQEFLDPTTAFDGVLDFDGTSGASHYFIQVDSSAQATLTSAADLALFTASVPGETIPLLVLASGANNTTGGDGVYSLFWTSSAAYVEICFDYSAPIALECFGDGTSASCPCGNASPLGAQQGCLNSFGVGGALRATGTAEIGADTLLVTASNLPANTPTMLFQGTSAISLAFGDGLRCAGGSIRRLGTRTASAGIASFPPPGAAISVIGQATTGSTLRYQVWYRNAAVFCTSSTYNLTNALAIAW